MKKVLFTALLVALILAPAAMFGQNVANYFEQGGARWVIGGSLDVASGGDLDIESGGALKIGGTAVTASAAEVNALASTGLSAAELAFLNGVTAGTTVASKAVVVDANKRVDDLDITALEIGNVDITATGAEVNTLAGVTGGTVTASKALVVDANKRLDDLDVTALEIGNVDVTATAAQLNAAGGNTGTIKAGRHTVTNGEATGGTLAITTGLTSIAAQTVQVLTAGNDSTIDADVTVSGGTITVADGSTYNTAESDVINWIAVGAL